MPETKTQTAKVRWLHELGYEIKDISKGLGVRYQQVRNMVLTQPKRAAREDMPPLKIELLEMEDVVDSLLGDELERTHQEARKQQRRDIKQQARRARELTTSTTLTEDDFGNEDLDNENYGR